MKKLSLIIKLWLPVIVWCGFIFYLSSIPNLKATKNPFWDETIRSIIHGLFYAFLYLLFFRAINFKRNNKDFLTPITLSCLYALSDETHQLFVPTRTFQLKDILVDFTGIFAGALILWRLLPKIPVKLKNLGKRLDLI